MPESPAPSAPKNPQSSLADLKRRLNQAQEIVVSSDGQIHAPNDPKVSENTSQNKTVLKPQRWF